MSELVVKDNPKSSVAEAIRLIRTNIQFSIKLKKGRSILIASSIPGEGKSFISSNLAISFAQKNMRVLIVDSDLRLGRLHNIFNTYNKEGFSDLLVEGDYENYSKYIRETGIENLSLITRGTIPPNPSELLESENAREFVEKVEGDFDIILFDGTPINGLSDSLAFAKHVDSVILVAASNYTKHNFLEESIKSINNLSYNLAGVILNKVPNAMNSSYYGTYGSYVDK